MDQLRREEKHLQAVGQGLMPKRDKGNERDYGQVNHGEVPSTQHLNYDKWRELSNDQLGRTERA